MFSRKIGLSVMLSAIVFILTDVLTFANTGDIVFTFDFGYQSECEAAIGDDGTIYVSGYDLRSDGGYSHYMYAINADGTLKWKFETNGMCYSPSFDRDGIIYFGSMDNYLYALNRDSTLKWKYRIRGGMFHSTPSLEDDGTIYCGSTLGTLHAVNPDGTKKWEYDTNGCICSSPTIGRDGTIYFQSISTLSTTATSDFIYAVTPEGALKWSYELSSSKWLRDAGKSPSPIVGSDGTIYCATRSSYICAFNPDGTLKWSLDHDLMSSLCDPSIGSDGTIYFNHTRGSMAVGPDGTLQRIYYFYDGKSFSTMQDYVDASCPIGDDGNRIWNCNSMCGSPLINSEGTFYIADSIMEKARLYAFNPDGSIRWSTPIGDGPLASSPIMDSNGIIYIATMDAVLWAIDSGTNAGPAKSSWPMYRCNQYHTGKVNVENEPLSVENNAPSVIALLGNYPNPFNPGTTISLTIPHAQHVTVDLYTVTGQKIGTLMDDFTEAGKHSVLWNASGFSSGIYFYTVRAGKYEKTMKMMLMR